MDKVIKSPHKRCSVPECSSKLGPSVALHLFPRDDRLKAFWRLKLRIDKPISKYMYVCSQHFLKDDYILPNVPFKRKALKKGAIPSQNLPGSKSDDDTSSEITKSRQMAKVVKSSHKRCCVPQCSSRLCSNVTMHLFPRDDVLRAFWRIKLKIGKPVTKYMYVCSQHFLKDDYILPDVPTKRKVLKQFAIPTLNLPVGKPETDTSSETSK